MNKAIDTKLGKPIYEKTFAQDCRIYTPEKENKFSNIMDCLDMFVVAHLLGWATKMIIVRDFTLCMI